MLCYTSLVKCGDAVIANRRLKVQISLKKWVKKFFFKKKKILL